MKRLHIHLAVNDLDASVRFYSGLFASAPSVLKPDYAKWMLDDPRVNFAISTRSGRTGLDHLGIQTENDAELDALQQRITAIDAPTVAQGRTTCCYAESEKSWVIDPQGVAWEAYRTLGEAALYGSEAASTGQQGACCAPAGATRQVSAAIPRQTKACAPRRPESA